jgi:uncharacterized protein (TIGR02569 family)
MNPPPPRVVTAFVGHACVPTPLPGGQRTAWRAGELALKPLDMAPEQLEWQAEVLAQLPRDDLRIALPVRSRSGQLVVDGWTAWSWMAGHHQAPWPEVISAGERFHDALAAVPRPDFLNNGLDRWTQADRLAWGESVPSDDQLLLPGVQWLLFARRNIKSESQLIHGDLASNVLLANDQPPAIIDFSPYWRPKNYASAIVIVDAIAWRNGSVDLTDTVLEDREGDQLVVRALLFRLFSDSDPTSGRYHLMIQRLRQMLPE